MKIKEAIHYKAAPGIIDVSACRQADGTLVVEEDLVTDDVMGMAETAQARTIVVVAEGDVVTGIVSPRVFQESTPKFAHLGTPSTRRFDHYWCTVGSHLSYEDPCSIHACACVPLTIVV